MVKAEINAILVDHFCQDLIAPVNAAYENEKARILDEFIAGWQVKRDGTRRGIIEVRA